MKNNSLKRVEITRLGDAMETLGKKVLIYENKLESVVNIDLRDLYILK